MKRRRYLVDKSLQFKYAAIVVSFAIVAAFLAGYTVFYTGWNLLGERLADVYPQGRLMVVFRAVNAALLRNTLLLLPLIILIAIIFSHRMAGPIIRIERVLDEMTRGGLDTKIVLRKRDELKRVAEAIDKMRMGLKADKERRDSLLANISERVSSLEGRLSREVPERDGIDKDIASIRQALSEIKRHSIGEEDREDGKVC